MDNTSSGIDMQQIAAILDHKLDKFKRELAEESSSQLQSAVKKAKLSNVSFKKKGCEAQFHHNEDVQEKIEEALSSIDTGKLQKAQSSLEEGITIINKRQKIIKIADKNGWDTVNEYLSDDLASDSDDDKRLSKAIRQADYKRRENERSRKKRGTNRFRSFRSSSNIINTGSAASSTSAAVGFQYRQAGGSSRGHGGAATQTCWGCGQVGHIQYQCPQRAGGSQFQQGANQAQR